MLVIWHMGINGINRCLWILALSGTLSSCYIIQNPPPGLPFVVHYRMKDESAHKSTPKRLLINRIKKSLPLEKRGFAGIRILKTPPVFDSLRMRLALSNMQAELANNGYFHAKLRYVAKHVLVRTRRAGEQDRVKVTIGVDMGEPYYIRRFVYHIDQPILRGLIRDIHLSLIHI